MSNGRYHPIHHIALNYNVRLQLQSSSSGASDTPRFHLPSWTQIDAKREKALNWSWSPNEKNHIKSMCAQSNSSSNIISFVKSATAASSIVAGTLHLKWIAYQMLSFGRCHGAKVRQNSGRKCNLLPNGLLVGHAIRQQQQQQQKPRVHPIYLYWIRPWQLPG